MRVRITPAPVFIAEMDYNSVHSKIWNDKKVRRLSKDGKLLFMYMLTNTGLTMSGLYDFDPEEAAKKTGLTDDQFHCALRQMLEGQLIAFDEDSWRLWVINKFSYSPKSVQVCKHVAAQLINEYEKPFVREFVRKYNGYIAQYLPPEMRI